MDGSAPDLGLGSLSEFEPAKDVEKREPIEPMSAEHRNAIDDISKKHGFAKVSNPPTIPRRARRGLSEPMHQINVRAPVKVIASFMSYCDRERLTYGEAIEKLMANLKERR